MQGLADINEEAWARARFVAYYAMIPHIKKNAKLKMSDLIELSRDHKNKPFTGKPVKAYRLTPEEVKQWHEGTWLPN